ncbi:hypothetical protein L596_001087 [Steinernema carpocapsae]|uniref:Uncharacterized protein n=1 Tax=Steinernema carpocapsae TaxID=34508 RepID=A0A4U8UP86_STECR|nr:hypothetical protein L596_001087 [Steinernema carpocapsae]
MTNMILGEAKLQIDENEWISEKSNERLKKMNTVKDFLFGTSKTFFDVEMVLAALKIFMKFYNSAASALAARISLNRHIAEGFFAKLRLLSLLLSEMTLSEDVVLKRLSVPLLRGLGFTEFRASSGRVVNKETDQRSFNSLKSLETSDERPGRKSKTSPENSVARGRAKDDHTGSHW